MTLEQLGYQLHGAVYVKHIQNYEIQVAPTSNPKIFVRRIILADQIKDIRKVNIYNLEKDKAFLEVLRVRKPGVRLTPRHRDVEDELEEVILKKPTRIQLSGTVEDEREIGYEEVEYIKPVKQVEIHLNKNRGE